MFVSLGPSHKIKHLCCVVCSGLVANSAPKQLNSLLWCWMGNISKKDTSNIALKLFYLIFPAVGPDEQLGSVPPKAFRLNKMRPLL